MAIYHLHAQIIGRSKGQSAVAAAAYRATQKLTDQETGIVQDYTRKERAEYAGIITPQGVPDWANNRAELWNEVQKRENRINSQFAREFDIALPIEFSEKERQKTTEQFCALFTSRGLVCDYAIHNHKGRDKSRPANPHAHIMVTTRTVTKEGWGEKDRDANTRDFLIQVRKDWENICNALLPQENKISCESLEAQGIERTPTQHMGKVATAMERKYKRREEKIARGEQLTPAEVKAEMPSRTRERKNYVPISAVIIPIDVSNDVEVLGIDTQIKNLEKERNEEIANIKKEQAELENQQKTAQAQSDVQPVKRTFGKRKTTFQKMSEAKQRMATQQQPVYARLSNGNMPKLPFDPNRVKFILPPSQHYLDNEKEFLKKWKKEFADKFDLTGLKENQIAAGVDWWNEEIRLGKTPFQNVEAAVKMQEAQSAPLVMRKQTPTSTQEQRQPPKEKQAVEYPTPNSDKPNLRDDSDDMDHIIHQYRLDNARYTDPQRSFKMALEQGAPQPTPQTNWQSEKTAQSPVMREQTQSKSEQEQPAPQATGQDLAQEKNRGYVEGACQVANIVKAQNLELGKEILKRCNITQAIAEKYAEPDTYKELQKDIYAPKVKQEQAVSKGRKM